MVVHLFIQVMGTYSAANSPALKKNNQTTPAPNLPKKTNKQKPPKSIESGLLEEQVQQNQGSYVFIRVSLVLPAIFE